MKQVTNHARGERGVTLVELVISMVVIGIALGGILLVMNYTTARSADPLIQHQGVAIAEAYLEEILTRAYDEDAVPGTADTEGAWGPDAGEGSRDLYDDVNDYQGLSDVGARDQTGAAIAGLTAYTVQVAVVAAPLNGAPAARVEVTVTHGSGFSLAVSGYRANY